MGTLVLRLACLALLCTVPGGLSAEQAKPDYVLWLEYETASEEIDGGGSSSSGGQQSLAERIISESKAGTEIEYFLPMDPEDIRGNAMWMFPARLFVSETGEKRLLNGDAMQARLDAWLKSAEWTREVCSRWIFTWIAQQIRCDNEAAFEAVEAYGMRPARMAVGESIALTGAKSRAVLLDGGVRNGRKVLLASSPIDPAFLREEASLNALALAEMIGEEITVAEAEAKAARINAVGTISIEFEVDETGLVWKRIERIDMTVTGLELGDKTRTSSQTVTRMTPQEWDDLKARWDEEERKSCEEIEKMQQTSMSRP